MANVLLTEGAVITVLSAITFAMVVMPDISLNTIEGLIFMFSLPAASVGLVLGPILMLAELDRLAGIVQRKRET